MKKTIYVCPVEGSVNKETQHSFIYNLSVIGNDVTINFTNKNYLTATPVSSTLHTTKSDIINLFASSGLRLNGKVTELVNEWPDEFIESVHYAFSFKG